MGDSPSQPPRTAVVTDSTASLTSDEAASLNVDVVPLEVVISGRTGLDLVEVSSEQVATALAGSEPVSTSRPAPARFMAAYDRARQNGATEVVSVHLSGELSGTVDAARLAARESTIPVTVIDSRQVGLGVGLAVLAAAELAQSGAGAQQVADEVTRICAGTSMLFYVDTLEFLRRGGRIGAASAFLGSVLAVKPLLEVTDGHIQPVEKIRTAARALARLEDLAVARAGSGPVRLGVHHLAAADRAEKVRDSLAARLPDASPVLVRQLGAVIGAHVGPGVVAVAVSPR
jgi:DegV family protein with EDD domain